MSNLFVQFADASETTIVSWFAGPQDSSAFPNQGTIEASDQRWKAYYDAQPQGVQAMLPPPTN